jgi:hypothetical protein
MMSHYRRRPKVMTSSPALDGVWISSRQDFCLLTEWRRGPAGSGNQLPTASANNLTCVGRGLEIANGQKTTLGGEH